MTHIFETASDKHVRGTYIYVNSTSDGYAYADEACTVNINAVDLTNMFNMGTAIVVDGGKFYRGISLAIDSGVATLTYVKTNGSTATTADLATVISKEAEAN